MSVLDGPGEGTWSVFAQKVVEERDEARHTLGRIAAVLFSSRAPLDDEELVEAMLMVIRERDEARHALHEILAVIHRDGGHYTGEHGHSKSVADAHATWAAMMREIDKLRAERRQLRARLVECRAWVGVCPWPGTPGWAEVSAIRGLCDDTLAEVK
jgi:hypothetical protein